MRRRTTRVVPVGVLVGLLIAASGWPAVQNPQGVPRYYLSWSIGEPQPDSDPSKFWTLELWDDGLVRLCTGDAEAKAGWPGSGCHLALPSAEDSAALNKAIAVVRQTGFSLPQGDNTFQVCEFASSWCHGSIIPVAPSQPVAPLLVVVEALIPRVTWKRCDNGV
jgi:hypothetical protein